VIRIRSSLERHENPGRQTLSLEESCEYAKGNTANYLLGLCLRADSLSMRKPILHPPLCAYFKRPVVSEIFPACVEVSQAFHDARGLVVEVQVMVTPEELDAMEGFGFH
jgi:hypothetical protein